MSASDPFGQLRTAVGEAAAALAGAPAEPVLERPRRDGFGDYSTNAAMLLAPVLKDAPRAIAERLAGTLGEGLGGDLERAEVAGPGFLNLFMTDAWLKGALAALLAAGEGFGAGTAQPREHIDVEFVSANPTGPLTVAAARHAAYGDGLARLLEFAGHRVEREYYVNDGGGQVRRFGESIRARARGEEPPEDGYLGDYVAELAAAIPDAAGGDPDETAKRGIELMLTGVRASLERMRVHMDRFSPESEFHDGVEAAFERLDGVFESEGAVWLRTTTFGDDKDRVLRRSNGELTYFATDIAYHADKLARGYDRAIVVLGADHHGYTSRIRAAWQALGGESSRLEHVIMQLVGLSEGGERVQMSKRAGTVVPLDDLLDDIGVDAARWFLLQRSHDTALDLDLDLARSESQDNPVYYVQYAHARIAGILTRAGEDAVSAALATDLAQSPEALHPSARALIKRLLELPGEAAEAAERRAPHRITTYALETAQAFSAFYRDVKVVGAAEEGGDERLRLALALGTQRVLARSLNLLGVSAPESM